MNSRHAYPGADLGRLEPLLDGDLALVFLDDPAAKPGHDLVCFRPNLGLGVLHRLLCVPVTNREAITGLPVPHHRYAGEALLLLDQWQDLLRPLADRLINLAGIVLESKYASVQFATS